MKGEEAEVTMKEEPVSDLELEAGEGNAGDCNVSTILLT